MKPYGQFAEAVFNHLLRQITAAEIRCSMAEAAFEAVNTPDSDMAELNRAEAEYEAAVADLAALEDKREEHEDDAGWEEPTGFRAMYFANKL